MLARSHLSRATAPFLCLISLFCFLSANADEIQVPPADVNVAAELLSQGGGQSEHEVTVSYVGDEDLTGPIRVEILDLANAQCFQNRKGQDKANNGKGKGKGKGNNGGTDEKRCGNSANMIDKVLNADGTSAAGNPEFHIEVDSVGPGGTVTFLLVTEGPVVSIDAAAVFGQTTDMALPEVTITTPNNLDTLGASPILVEGTVNELVDMLTLNGINVPLAGPTFSAQVDLSEGFNTIVARAIAANGDTATASVSVSLDMTPPYLSVDSHDDDDEVTTSTVTITGLVNDIVRGTVDQGEATVLVNGVEAAVSNKSFAVDIELFEGVNTILVEASDAIGNLNTLTFELIHTPPIGRYLEVASGQGQTAQIGTLLPNPLEVQVFGEGGLPAPGVNVIFTVEQGSGSLGNGSRSQIVATDSNGLASTQFAVGNRVGVANQKVKAVANGYNSAVFNASTVGLEGNKVTVNAGNNQRGAVGQQLPAPLIVTVTDAGSNVVEGANIEFEVVRGGGTMGNGQSTQTLTTDADGRVAAQYVLGPETGVDAQRIRATMTNSLGTFTGTFSATAFVPSDSGNTSITGIVLDNQNNPVPGATVRVDGTTRQAQAGANGRFEITQVPVGPVHLVADGSTATVPGEFPALSYNLVTIAGVRNPMIAPIYMVRLNTEDRVFAGPNDVVLTLDEFPGFALEIAKDSVTFPDGSRQGYISVTPVNASKVPNAPPDGMQPQFIVTVQPEGARFDPPARLTLPNVEGKAPGEQFEMFSFDHDLEEFVGIGLGTVSEDGLVVRSNPGVGIIKAGWHCGAQPNQTGSVAGSSAAPVACETETVNVLNRVANVFSDGTFEIDNVPANQGFVRAVSQCVDEVTGDVLTGESDYFEVSPNLTTSGIVLNYPPAPDPIPVDLDFESASDIQLVVSDPADTFQTTVTATYPDGSTADVTTDASISYTTTNSSVATVSSSGEVTGVGAGVALVTARADGVIASRGVVVSGGAGADSDDDGIDDDVEIALGLDPTDPVDAEEDVDEDGLTALEEIAEGTDIFDADTDGDGREDGEEVNGAIQTSPLLADSDGDGVFDGLEVIVGSDPNDAQDFDLETSLAEITITPDAGTIVFNSVLGEGSLQLSVTGLMLDGNTLDLTTEASYDTSDVNICNPVGQTGEVLAGQEGVCQITATFDSFTAESLLQVLNFTASSSGYLDLPGNAAEIAVVGDYAYIPSFGEGITIVDVSDRNFPVMAGSHPLTEAHAIAVAGSVAYVANGSNGIVALDISNPTAPAQLGTLNPGFAQALVAVGNRLYVTGGATWIIDTSDPANMSVLGTFGTGGGGIDTDGSLVAVATGPDVKLVDVSDEANPALAGTVFTVASQDIDFVNGALLVGDASVSLSSWDVSDPSNPALVETVPQQNAGLILDLVTIDGLTFAADNFFVNGVSITDSRFAPSLAPKEILDFSNIRDDEGIAVDADGQYVYLIAEKGGAYRLYIGQYVADEDSEQFVPPSENPGILEFYAASQFFDEREDFMRVFVRRSQGTQGTVSVDYATDGGTQTANVDYVPVSGTLTWGDGDDSLKAFDIPIIDDMDFEPFEYVQTRLSNVTGGAIIGVATTLVAIASDETEPGFPGYIATREFGVQVDESIGSVTLNAVRLASDTGAVSADYFTPGPGSAPDNIGPTSGTLAWADGDRSVQQFTVPVIDDFTPETLARTFVGLQNVTGGAALLFNPEIDVIDDDGGPLAGRIEFANRSFRTTENHAFMEFTVLRKGSAFGVVTAEFRTFANDSATAGVDYDDVQQTLTWQDGDASPRTITVPINQDTEIEGNEFFIAVLENPTGGAEVGPFNLGLIFDDDFDDGDNDSDGLPNFIDSDDDNDGLTDEEELANGLDPFDDSDAQADPDGDGFTSFDEITIYGTDPLDGASAPQAGRMEMYSSLSAVGESEGQIDLSVVRLDGDIGAASVDYSVSAITADGADFTSTSGTLNWADGDDEPKSFSVLISDDAVVENIEYFVATISSATGADLGFDRTLVEIYDDDSASNPGIVTFRHSRLSTPEDAGSVTYELIRVGGDSGAVSVDYEVVGDEFTGIGTDILANSGTLTWADGDTTPQSITIDVVDDAEPETTELFAINLSNLQGGVNANGTNSEIILDNDNNPAGGRVGFSKNLFFAVESEGQVEATLFRVGGRSDASGDLLLDTIEFTVPPFPAAIPGVDYTDTPATISWADNDAGLRKHIVPLIDDSDFEGFLVELFLTRLDTNGSAVVTADRPDSPTTDFGTFVIIDDDQAVDGGVIGLTASTYTVSETNPVFQISRSGGVTGAASVDVAVTGDITDDFSTLFGINEGGVREFALNVDTGNTGTRTVTVTLSSSDLGIASLGTTSATITVLEDTDLDGVPDVDDDFPNDPNETTDTDGDGIGDNADTDDDDDGVEDTTEALIGSDALDTANPTVIEPALEQCIVGYAQLNGVTSVDEFTDLDCRSRGITSLEGIEGMHALTFLEIRDNAITDLGPVASLPNLQWLIAGINNISDVTPLQDMFSLIGLYVWQNNVTDVTPLANLTQLEFLELGGNTVSDVSSLSGLTSLRQLSLWDNTVDDIGVVGNFSQLEQLNLDGNAVSELPALAPTLISLRAMNNDLTDVDELGGFTNLQEVEVWGNDIAVMPDLSASPDLGWVGFGNNELTAIGPLPATLGGLNLAQNQISDLSPLGGLTDIGILDLADNHLSNEDADGASVLVTLTSLNELYIQTNAIDFFDDLFAALPDTFIESDAGKPAVVDLVMTPADTLDVDVDGELAVAIETSTFAGGQIEMTSPSGATVSFGYPGDGTAWPFFFSAFSEKGTWEITGIEIFDAQHRRYNAFGVQTLLSAFDTDIDIVGTQLDDTDPPVLQSVSISETSVDLSAGPVLVNFTATFTDDISGTAWIHMQLVDEFGNILFDGNGSGDTISVDYPVGVADAGAIRIGWLNAGDAANNDEGRDYNELVDQGFPAEVTVTGSVSKQTVQGRFDNSEGDFPSAPGNPSFQFTADEDGIVGIDFAWIDNCCRGVVYDVHDSSGSLIASNEGQHAEAPAIGLDLLAGDYSLALRSCCGSGDFELTFVGAVSGIEQDLDSDGIVDSVDTDDDGDGISDSDETANGLDPLNRTDASADFDGDGASNRIEIAYGTDIDDDGSTPPTVGELAFDDPAVEQCLTDQGWDGSYPDQVEFMHCDSYGIGSLGGLEQLVGLRDANFGNNAIADVSPLANLPLQNISVWNNQVSDLSPLAGMLLVDNIDFGGNEIGDITVLSTMPNLGGVSLWGNQISDISPLDSLVHLGHLNVDGNLLTTLPPLPASLHNLHLSDNQLTDVSALSTLHNLQGVWLRNNEITSLPDLSALNDLWNIDLEGNDLTDLSGLPANIGDVSAGRNHIDNLDALDGFANLQFLWLADNHLGDEDADAASVLVSRTSLQELDIRTNAITDFTQIDANLSATNIQDDRNRPDITSLQLDPDVLDVDVQSELEISVTTSTGDGGDLRLTSPNGIEFLSFFDGSGNPNFLFFDAFVDKGIWEVSRIEIFGSEHWTYNAFAIQTLLAGSVDTSVEITGSEASDFTAPTLETFSISNTSVDLSAGVVEITFDATASDDLSGVSFINLQLEDENFELIFNNNQNSNTLSFDYPVGVHPGSVIYVRGVGVSDFGSNGDFVDRNRLAAMGFPTQIDVSGSVPLTQLDGRFNGSEGSHPGALGNPSYHFEVDSSSFVGIAVNGVEWCCAGIVLELRDGAGNLVTTTQEPDAYIETPTIGETLAAGSYVVKVMTDCCGFDDREFQISFAGDVSAVDVDTDSDGTVDAFDDDDDGDGISDDDEISWGLDPLFRGDADADNDGDGASNRAEINGGGDPNDPAVLPSTIGDLSFADPGLESCLTDSGLDGLFPDEVHDLWCEDRGISDLGGIDQLTELSNINFGRNQISDITPLAGLSNLRGISMFSNQVSDLSPIAGLVLLDGIDFGGNAISDITPIANLTNLGNLHLWGNLLTDASVVSGLSNLHSLNLDNNLLTALPASLPAGLSDLGISDNELTDISVVASLTNLEFLRMDGLGLTSLPSLQSFGLDTVSVNRNELTSLAGIPLGVRFIFADNNAIDDLGALSDMDSLEELYLHDNHLANDDADGTSVLATLGSLTTLNITNNAITDFSALTATNIESDEGRPALTSVVLDPNTTVDLDTDPSIEVSFTVDGGHNGDFDLTSPSGSITLGGFLSGDGSPSFIGFSPNTEQGTWSISRIGIHSPQFHEYNQYAIETLFGFDTAVDLTGTEPEDTTPPTIQDLQVSSPDVDLAGGPVVVDFTGTFDDGLSGMNYVYFALTDGNGMVLYEGSSNGATLDLPYPVGVADVSEIRVNYLNVNDSAGNNREYAFNDLLAAGYPARVNVSGTVAKQFLSGQFDNPEGTHEGALGNPSYRFELVSGDTVGFAFDWNGGCCTGAALVLKDDGGTELGSTVDLNTGQPRLGVDGLAPGTYELEVRADCCNPVNFDITAVGDVGNFQLDTDNDGRIDDGEDSDDDNDGALDGSDSAPLVRDVQ